MKLVDLKLARKGGMPPSSDTVLIILWMLSRFVFMTGLQHSDSINGAMTTHQ